jgi:hypothetical protein
MDYLKQHWIKEVECEGDVKHLMQPASDSSAAANSDDNPAEDNDFFDAEYESADASAYVQQQQQNDIPMPNVLDFNNQGMQQGAFVPSHESAFETSLQFNGFAEPGVDAFQYDAFMGQ